MATKIKLTANCKEDMSHQTSPAWVVTFLRWANRTSSNVFPGFDKDRVRRPLVVENDAVHITVAYNKASPNHTVQILLKGGDVNYRTAVAAGDYIFVNMLNDPFTAAKVADNARRLAPINNVKDGFKGLFRVKGVRKVLRMNEAGVKTLAYMVTGVAFTPLNNIIYFNPYLFGPEEGQDQFLFVSRLGGDWNKLVNEKSIVDNQDIIKLFFTAFLGEGLSEDAKKVKGLIRNFNDHFLIPEGLGSLLGMGGAKKYIDIIDFIMGVQRYSSFSDNADLDTFDYSKIFNPGIARVDGRFYETNSKIEGRSFIKPEYWNQTQAYSIIKQYLNPPLNEIYTCFRVSPNSSKIMPTVVVRQIPFTSQHYKGGMDVTRFLSMPRWVLDPSMITGFDMGVDDDARVNFVQMFGQSPYIPNPNGVSAQIAQGNYVYDIGDVERHGLHPYIVSSNSDYPVDNDKGYLAPTWKDLIADAVFDGHLKESGTISSAGIVEPVSVGDNLQLGSVVYQMESITHVCSISPKGVPMFRTAFALSNGMDERSNASTPVYPEMVHTDYDELAKEDFQFEQFYPGATDVQDVAGREDGERVKDIVSPPFNPNVPPRRK